MDLLLDTNIVVALCAEKAPEYALAKRAIKQCQQTGGRVWLYVGNVQAMEHATCAALPKHDVQQVRHLLQSFAQDKHWLAALAAEGPVFDAPNPGAAQLLQALQRFPADSIKLLTHNSALLDAYPTQTLTAQAYLDSLPQQRAQAFIDLAAQQDQLRPDLEQRIHQTLHHGQYILGPEVQTLEHKLATFVGVEHCIGVASGSDALLIALMALGVGAGDEVITTPLSFIASAEVIVLLGARPVFVDIDPRTYTLDPAHLEAAISPRTKAILPVSLYGQCVDFDAINVIAEQHQLPVVEDAAQSFGAQYQGRYSCSLSTIGCTSFFPSKPLGAYGDGGACFTNDADLAQAMREIRVHGQAQRYQHQRIGKNSRLDTLQAAILLSKLDKFPEEIQHRQAIGARYTQLLESLDGVQTPHIAPGNTSVYAQYSIQVEDRARVQHCLQQNHLPSAIHYPRLLPEQASLQIQGEFPQARSVADKIISLPMYPYLAAETQAQIVAVLRKHLEG